MTSGIYYGPVVTSDTTGTFTNQTVYYIPIVITASTTFDRIAVRTSSVHSGSSTVRLGVYNSSNYAPNTVAFDAGTVVCNASSTTFTITISQTLGPGLFWLAFCLQGVTGTASFNAIPKLDLIAPQVRQSALFEQETAPTQTGVTGAFATAASLTWGWIVNPKVALRKA